MTSSKVMLVEMKLVSLVIKMSAKAETVPKEEADGEAEVKAIEEAEEKSIDMEVANKMVPARKANVRERL